MTTEHRGRRPAAAPTGTKLLILAGATFAPAFALAAQLQVSTGVDYFQGDYGRDTDTQVLMVPFSVRWSLGSFSLRAAVPYLGIRGPAGIAPVVDDDGGERSSNSGSGSSNSGSGSSDEDFDDPDEPDDDDFADDRDVHGLGDVTVSGTWTFRDIAGSKLYLDLTGRVRLPTASTANGLGRGATDYKAQTEIGWDGAGGGVFLIAGRRFLESVGDEVRVNGWQGGAGYWRNIGQRSVFGMQANWRESASPDGEDPRSIEAFLMRGLSTGWRLEVHAGAGLGSASADYTAGLKFTWKTGRR